MEEKLISYSKLSVNGCWEWQRRKDEDGYGRVYSSNSRSTKRAHRMSYETFIGEIPKGLVVMHSCDNPCCINPLHLSVGTHKENSQDMVKKGRSKTPIYKGADHPMVKLTTSQVISIRTESGYQKTLAEKYGVSQSLIAQIKNGKRWKHIE